VSERFPALRPIEIATAMPLGARSTPVEPLPSAEPGHERMRWALEEAVLRALLRPPCVVSFSGGRDSSAVLALAVHVARREGLPFPIPMTLEFDAPRTQEAEWQLQVIEHLGIDEWNRIELTQEMELLGDVARAVLVRHGVTLPSNLHLHAPIIEAAAGGSLLTGAGGDEIFQSWPWSRRGMAAHLRHQRNRIVARQLFIMSLPPPARRALLRRVRRVRYPWLTDTGVAAATKLVVDQATTYTPTFQGAIDAYWQGRYSELLHGSLAILGRASDVQVISPFATPEFLAATRATVPPSGFKSRTHAMRDLVGDLLPAETVSRSTKAVFTELAWGPRSYAFAAGWDGTAVPTDFVDVDALRATWSQPVAARASRTLLQHAWLSHYETEPTTVP
jgi:asparagine synthase (glutamine-hydrolysing)